MDAWFRRRPVLVDCLVTAVLLFVFFVGNVGIYGFYPGEVHPAFVQEQVLLLLLTVGQLAPWAIRRWNPLLSAGLIAAACLIHLVWGPEFLGSLVAVPMTVYNLAVRAPQWASVAGIGLALAGSVANGIKVWMWPRPWLTPDGTEIGATPGDFTAFLVMSIMCSAVVLAAWAFGDLARTRRIALQQLEDRARQLEVEAAQERELEREQDGQAVARRFAPWRRSKV